MPPKRNPRASKSSRGKGQTKPKVQDCLDSIKKHHSIDVRQEAVQRLGKLAERRAIPKRDARRVEKALFAALFDFNKNVRFHASSTLSRIIGLRAVVDFINKHYPGETLSMVPAQFFQREISVEKLLELRKRGSPPLGRLGELRKKYGKPVFYHRGFPVFLSQEIRSGKYVNGAFLLARDTRLLPKKFRRAVAEHEFGEIFSHTVGNALQMLWLERHKLLQEYMEHRHDKRMQFREIVKQNQGFAEFRKHFPELTT